MKEYKQIILLLFICFSYLIGQNDPANPAPIDERLMNQNIKSIWFENEAAEIYPVPVYADYQDKYYNLYDENEKPVVAVLVNNNTHKNVAAILNNQLSKYNYSPLPIVSEEEIIPNYKSIIKFSTNAETLKNKGEQAYQILFNDNGIVEIILSGNSEQGLIYAAVSIAQLITKQNGEVKIRKAEVLDYPKYSRRIFNTNPMSYHLTEDLDWMLRYKIESLTFHNSDYSWNEADGVLKTNLTIYEKWKEIYGGVKAIIILNLYAGDYDIEITNRTHQDKLKNFIKSSYLKGVTRFMINADDSPPFKYGEGYLLDSENDQKKFTSLAEAHCWLMNDIYNWAKDNKYDLELIYCPSFYTYEEMHYGDMELFKNTPWEKDAYDPLKRDLKIFGEKMNKNIEIGWTGPYVCTRKLTDADIEDWTKNLENSRKPFFFDNSIFSHLEYTASSMFTEYENDFPANFSAKVGANAIYINGDATGETSRAASMTANAYMWEEERYNPETSIIAAMTKLYGSSNINLLFSYKDVELELCKTIRQRELWFAADELWQSIRRTRFITEKNPFHYHQNYSRLKALRMQIKNSVPEPEDYNVYNEKILKLEQQRKNLLQLIENRSLKKLSYSLQAEMIKVPINEDIQ